MPSTAALHDIYAEPYFDHGKYDNEFAQRREYEKRMALLSQTGLPKGARILDAGCATGDFIAFASPHYDMWGLELSPFAAEKARERNPDIAAQIRAGVIEEQDFAPGFFDAIVMWDVVEHIPKPVDACDKLLRVLRPGGFLLVSTPDIGALTARLMKRYWAFMTPPEHLGFFNHRTLRRMLEKRLDLEMLHQSSTGKWVNVSFLAYKLRRVLPKLVPNALVSGLRDTAIGKSSVYVPTMDIQYATAQKPAGKGS